MGTGNNPFNTTPPRKLQIRQRKNYIEVVDKETQQPIAGVADWQIDYTLTSVKATIEIVITDPSDIFVGTEEVEGTISDTPPRALPIPILMIAENNAMDTRERLTQVQQAIQEERTRREYNVLVSHPRRAHGIAGVPIPAGLEAYTATTTCTEQHESGRQCVWADFAFFIKGRVHVVLESDLMRPGFLPEESIKMILETLEEE
jgi:hypothetical protein